MSTNIASLSELELAELISRASKELEQKQKSKKGEVIAQIKELAASIGVQIEFGETNKARSTRKGSTVAIKYRDPDNASNTWTGRGVKPRWLNAYLEQGRSIEDFKIQ